MNRLRHLEVKQLRVLDALIRERNLSRVAASMGLTQQAISVQLKKLRELFGDRLFVRTNNGVVPTPFTEGLQPKVAVALEALEQLLEEPEFDLRRVQRTLNISATDYGQRVILPKLIEALWAEAPGVRVICREAEIDELYTSLLSGAVDLAITVPEFLPSNCPFDVLFSEHYVCVGSSKRRRSRQPLAVDRLADMPQVVVSPARANLRGSADAWFADQGLQRNVVLSVPVFSAIPDCIQHTDIVAFMPSRLLPHPQLKVIKLEESPPGFDAIVGWHNRSSQDPLVGWVRQRLHSVC